MISSATLVAYLSAFPVWGLWLLSIPLMYGVVLLFGRFFGLVGLVVCNILLVLMANVQVLKTVPLPLPNAHVALGTIPMATTYLITDILAEYYGKKWALKIVLLGFSGFAFWTCMALLTVGFRSSPSTSPVQNALQIIFLPMPRLFLAGMVSYLVSQVTDIALFQWIRRLTRKRSLWLRNTVSTAFSALLDNTVFSLLAWIILAPLPLPFGEVLKTYILGTYALRLLLAVIDTPVVYLARHVLRRSPVPL